MTPKAARMEPKGSQKGAKGSQKGAKGRPKCIQKSIFGKGRETVAKGGDRRMSRPLSFGSFPVKHPEKTPPKKHPEIDAEKVRKNMEKHAKNMLKLGQKSMEKRLTFEQGGICLKAF